MSTITPRAGTDLQAIEWGRADEHPAGVYLARLAESGRRTMRTCLDTIAGILTDGTLDAHALPWHQLRYQHTQAVRARLIEEYAPATVNKHLSALRGTLKEAWRLGLMGAEDYHRAVDIENVSGETLPAGRSLNTGELRALFQVCAEDDSPAGPRDAAILAVLYGGGLRRAEAVALDVGAYDPDSGALTVTRGKGRRERLAYATNGGAAALDDWLQARGNEPGPLFVAINKAGVIDPDLGRLTGQAILYILRKRADQAGADSFSPHDLRRTFIGDLLDAGADIVTVQHLAGHASVNTTARYDRRPERRKREAAELLHVPYARG